MWPLTDEEIESYNNRKFCHICKKKSHDVNDSNDDSDIIAMMMRKLMPGSFMVMLQDLMMFMIITAIMMIMVTNLMPVNFMALLQDLMMLLMTMMVRNFTSESLMMILQYLMLFMMITFIMMIMMKKV